MRVMYDIAFTAADVTSKIFSKRKLREISCNGKIT